MSSLRNAAVLSKVEVQGVVVPLPGQHEEEHGAEGDHENVQDAEEDEVRGDANLVAALRDTKGDGVEQPQEVEVAGENEVVARSTDALGADDALGEGRGGHGEIGDGAEDEETPLVDGRRIGGNEVADDPDPGEEDLPGDGGPGRVGYKSEEYVDDGERDDPVDVLVEEDLAIRDE